nr:hypothetical protein CPGR_03171 [Mycolicibacter nonchromogenicus]
MTASSAQVRQLPVKNGALTRQNCCPHRVNLAIRNATARNTTNVMTHACMVHISERRGSDGQSMLG